MDVEWIFIDIQSVLYYSCHCLLNPNPHLRLFMQSLFDISLLIIASCTSCLQERLDVTLFHRLDTVHALVIFDPESLGTFVKPTNYQ